MSLSAATVLILIVVGLLVGGLMALRSSARTGMPTQEVLDRAKQRASDLEAEDKRQQDRD